MDQVQEPQIQETKQPQESLEPNLTEQFQQADKRERYIAAERKKIEEAKRAFEAEKEEVMRYRSLKEKDPFEILEHFGVTYDKLLEADQRRSKTPIDPVAKKALETVEQLKLELKTKEEEAEKARLSKLELQLMSNIEKVIETEQYDLISHFEEHDAVKDYMMEIYEHTGSIPTVREACEAINGALAEKILKVKGSKWLQPKEEPVKEAPVAPKKTETLTNKMVQSSSPKPKPMTEKERIKAAIEAMNATRSGR